MKKTTIIVLVLVILGLVLVAVAVLLEARSYPWRHRLGLPAQDAAALPEPSPVVPAEEEAVVVYLEAVEPTAAPEVADAPAETPEVLPGAEEDEEAAGEPAEEIAPQKQYTVIGTLKIPALNVSQNILEGTGRELKYGVGRLTLSQYPGERGNCVIAGHRPYPFRYLDLLTQGDIISLRFSGLTYTYSVYESFEVLPTETWVLSPIKGHPYTLTLITCTPYLVSSHRLIVRAELTAIDGVPFEDPATAGGEDTGADGDSADGEIVDGEGEGTLPAGETGGGMGAGETGFEGETGAPENSPAAESSLPAQSPATDSSGGAAAEVSLPTEMPE
ncbi:MAG TPA: class D sortase [Papillibacter sp.]|jgi:LPXTG-site transpeptidase (sortase) family protein|nr:class D sortase [Papillibacter sp.]